MILALLGGISGIVRIIAGAALAFAVCAAIIIPLERRAERQRVELSFKATAAEAKAAELQRQINGGLIVIEAYQVQLKNERDRQEIESAENERRISEYETLRKTAGRSCAVDSIDRRFLLDLK